ncbi:MAG: riboflavin synthase [Gemmatimonadaceae bacterium]|nr:riboflavin synthase [Gemmatimonadaceae bacterium]NUQ94395.1 riboflavin synthase [Gemmatimonadaceae bacterium]NUR19205.1 riboflavin synthase [Gemmatimonadaceae bacterium]NUS99314.1 riboflavin synthase [Gemmatimonadaceae bacterium]
MFTGIVDDVGTIERVATTAAGRELRIRTRYADLVDGESIACNGACLTVREHGEGWFTVAAVVTTLDRTTIGDWREGTKVNLERAMRASDRIGGHIVQGHVDCVGEVTAVSRRGDALLVDVAVPEEIALLMVPHGSVTVDGVSLTVNALVGGEGFQLSIIEYTEGRTTLGGLRVGSRVHVEGDVIAKHVQRLFAAQRAALT